MTTQPPPLDELRRIDAADVYKDERPAGRLVRDGENIVFSYRPDYLADPGAAPLARTLPRSADPVRTPAGAVPRSSPACSRKGPGCGPWCPGPGRAGPDCGLVVPEHRVDRIGLGDRATELLGAFLRRRLAEVGGDRLAD